MWNLVAMPPHVTKTGNNPIKIKIKYQKNYVFSSFLIITKTYSFEHKQNIKALIK